jgi:hypothetical protein
MFQNFALGIEGLRGPVVGLRRLQPRKEPSGVDLGLWPSQQSCLLRPSLAISEWQINQLKMQAKSVEKSMGEVD